MKTRWRWLLASAIVLVVRPTFAEEVPLPKAWKYADAMREVLSKSLARAGVVLHVGDSITYANPYGQWPRAGQAKSAEDMAILKWMHTDANDDSDGWWLARFDHPAGGRSYTACSGLRADELLKGGKQKMPPLAEILKTYRPQMVVLMIGTNDASANRSVEAYRVDLKTAVDQVLAQRSVCILSTIPPHPARRELAKSYNVAVRELAKQRQLPLIDYEAEILKRRPDHWNGTLLTKDDVHPTAGTQQVPITAAPNAENLRNNGYLLRGWLTVRKIAEVKCSVVDNAQ